MQISKSRLKEIVKEELIKLNEMHETESLEDIESQLADLNVKSSIMGSLLKGKELEDFKNEYANLLQKYQELGGEEY